jgi:sirohydrochlorin cobaltochelatase
MVERQRDKAAPMASAPMRYTPDRQVDWGNMWDTFCDLALDGGPPHRGALLCPGDVTRPDSPGYLAVVAELDRGVRAVCAMGVTVAEPGWVALRCESAGMARWLAEAIQHENVAARHRGELLFLPAGADYTLKGEVKNVITAVAKTTHYWSEHLPQAAKDAVEAQERLSSLWQGIRRRFGSA